MRLTVTEKKSFSDIISGFPEWHQVLILKNKSFFINTLISIRMSSFSVQSFPVEVFSKLQIS